MIEPHGELSYPKKNKKKEDPLEVPWAWIKCVGHLVSHPEVYYLPMPAELLPWLFLGDERTALDVPRLKAAGITHVLSLNPMPSRQVLFMQSNFDAAGIVHRYEPGEDEEGYDMIGLHWDACRAFLMHARNGGGTALVHCGQGINRSALIACAAHMVFERTPVVDVVRNCVERRGMVMCNRSFQGQLCALAAAEGLLGDKPPGYNDDPVE